MLTNVLPLSWAWPFSRLFFILFQTNLRPANVDFLIYTGSASTYQYTHCGRIVDSAIMYATLSLNAQIRFPQLTTTILKRPKMGPSYQCCWWKAVRVPTRGDCRGEAAAASRSSGRFRRGIDGGGRFRFCVLLKNEAVYTTTPVAGSQGHSNSEIFSRAIWRAGGRLFRQTKW